jgi:hypothetical protein
VRDFAAMMVRGLGLLCCLLVLGAHDAHAQEGQFVLVDATFTASANNTMSSEYAVAPLPTAPANWRAPVDYAAGTVHVRVRVLEKPSDMQTLCNVCFKSADTLTCQPYPDPYTKPGVYDSKAEISRFWQYEVYDWTKPVERVNVVIKDQTGRFVQGNAAYFPTKLHVTVTVVPPGGRYVEPDVVPGEDADAGASPSQPSAPTAMANTPGSSGAAGNAGTAARAAAAGMSAATGAAGQASSVAVPPVAGDGRTISDYIERGSACSVTNACPKARYGVGVSIGVVALSLWQIARFGRRKRRVRSRGRRA